MKIHKLRRKKFITLAPGLNVIKLFLPSSSLKLRTKKLVRLVLATILCPVLKCPCKPTFVPYPQRVKQRVSPWVCHGQNTLAYFTGVSVDTKKVFKGMETRCQCYIKKFPLLLMMRSNKLECLYLAITFQSSLTFAGNTRSLPKKEASERRSNLVGSGLALKF